MTKATFISDYQAISTMLLNQYAEGVKQASGEIMAPAFHPNATMYSADENGKLAGGLVTETLLPAMSSFPKSPDANIVIAYIDIAGTTASARLDADNLTGGGSFTDYYNLLKIDGKWVIVSKIFQNN